MSIDAQVVRQAPPPALSGKMPSLNICWGHLAGGGFGEVSSVFPATSPRAPRRVLEGRAG